MKDPQCGWIRVGLCALVFAFAVALFQCGVSSPPNNSERVGAARANNRPETFRSDSNTYAPGTDDGGSFSEVHADAVSTRTSMPALSEKRGPVATTDTLQGPVRAQSITPPTPLPLASVDVGMGMGMGMGTGMGMGMGNPDEPVYTEEMGMTPIPASAAEIQNVFFRRVQDMNSFLDLTKQTCSVDWSSSVAYQLANWKDGGFTQESLDKHCLRKSIRISIVNGRIRVAWYTFTISGAQRIICMLWLLQLTLLRAAAAGRTIPDVELVAQTSDGAESSVGAPFHFDNAGPLFSNVKCNEDASVSFPMGFHDQFGSRASGAMSFRMYREFWEELDALNSDGPAESDKRPPEWPDKEPALFFSAGKQAGRGRPKTRGFRKNLFQIDSDKIKVVPESHPLSDYAKYKYLVYAYGRCGWSRRIRELAFVEAVLFVETSNCSEYFMQSLVPNEHYVSVAEDFSDLAAKVDEIDADQKKAKRLAASWLKHARSLLSLECVLDYIEALLVAYGPLQKFTPTEKASWKLYDLRNPDAHTVKFFQFKPLPEGECPGLGFVKQNKHQKLNC